MSALVQGRTCSETWLKALELTSAEPSGKKVHLFMTVEDPAATDDFKTRRAVDRYLTPTTKNPGLQAVATVANTIFPQSLYPEPQEAWRPVPTQDTTGIAERNAAVQASASALYARYAFLYPQLRRAHSENEKGTYFARMIGWPGHSADSRNKLGPVNQLQKRIDQIRYQHTTGRTAFNAADLAMGDDLEVDADLGVQILKATDNRLRSFPCLVHVDLGVYDGKVNLVGVYRLQQLVGKGYGNLLGLARLQKFIAQQTGFGIGELGMHATLATADFDILGKHGVTHLIDDAHEAALFTA